jgi:hypothetical protein
MKHEDISFIDWLNNGIITNTHQALNERSFYHEGFYDGKAVAFKDCKRYYRQFIQEGEQND